MKKNNRKWLTGLLSVAVASSMVVFPQWASAEQKVSVKATQNQQIAQQIDSFFQQHQDDFTRIRKSSNISAASNEVTSAVNEVLYKGTIGAETAHSYFFSVKESGTIHVTPSNSDQVGYYIKSFYDEGDSSNFLYDGATLEPGGYFFVVYPLDTQTHQYEYTISGITFDGTPSTVLPNLTVSNPSSHEVVLPKGVKTIQVQGTTDTITGLEVNFAYDQPYELNGSFNKNISLFGGFNYLEFFALNEHLNSVRKAYSIYAPGTDRISGADRFAVSANISKRIRKSYDSPVVYIARGDNYPDALSGAPLATAEGAPLLLTKTSSLPDSIKAELQRRDPNRVVLLGGTGAISSSVEKELSSLLPGVKVERIAGADRFVVSAAIAKRVVEKTKGEGGVDDAAFVASGLNFPDALSASAPAGERGMPILLVRKDTIPAPIDQFIKANSQIKKYYIVGGSDVVSNQIEQQLKLYGKDVVRIGGTTRYQTSVMVAQHFYNLDITPKRATVARGDLFPDALSGGPFAAIRGPLVLTPPTKLDPDVASYFSTQKPFSIYILGGTAAVSSGVETQLDTYIDPTLN